MSDVEAFWDSRMAELNARAGYREVSRWRDEDGLLTVKLERIDNTPNEES